MIRKGYNPQEIKPFKLSRSKIELFCECPFCFYMDRKLGVSQPSGLPFNLNSAVDHLLKKEFDLYREKREVHPLMLEHKIDALPFQHKKLDDWRKNQKGITYLHEPTQFLISGAVDEIWVNKIGELIIVDFKATSKSTEVTLDADWQLSYKRQMEVYQWLFRKNDFKVSNIGYFLYCNGKKDRPFFGNCLEFDISILPYQGDDSWVDFKLIEIHAVLSESQPPASHNSCNLCNYRIAAQIKIEALKE